MAKKYLVEIGNMYFVGFDEVQAIMIVADCPVSHKHATVFDTKEEADKVSRIIGGHVVEVIGDVVQYERTKHNSKT